MSVQRASSEPTVPRALKHATAREQRRQLLASEHSAALCRYVQALRDEKVGEVPDFDPIDGGVEAKILFLFEKPGPKTSVKGGGSGFISQDNDDPTAEATFRFMRQAGLPRRATATWNFVPAWNGTRRIVKEERAFGKASLKELLSLFENLRAVVLVGRKSVEGAGAFLDERGLPVIKSDHPSPLVRASFPDRWRAIPQIWAQARRYL